MSGRHWIRPAVNLITNLGFGASATHTTITDDLRLSLQRGSAPQRPVLSSDQFTHQIDEQFDRMVFLLVVLNLYRNVRGLRLWLRALGQSPNLVIPGLASNARGLLPPLRRPNELLAALEHVTPYREDNPRLRRLTADLVALAAHP